MTEADFMAAIIAAPEDDLPRLAFADELDARGQAERAEFIRVQCLYPTWFDDATCLEHSDHRPEYLSALDYLKNGPADRDLAKLLGGSWNSDLGRWVWYRRNGAGTVVKYRRGFVTEVRTTLAAWCGGERCVCAGPMEYRGGSVRRNEPAGDWTVSTAFSLAPPRDDCPACSGTGRTPGIAASVCKVTPVERVVAVDKRPSEWSAGPEGEAREWAWERSMNDQPDPEIYTYLGAGPFNADGDDEAARIPGEVFDSMAGESGAYYFAIGKHAYKRYPTPAAAHAALSDALLTLGRRRAAGQPDTAPGGG